ncbi:MAG TPA: hypothetical protein VLA95_04210 [Gemmatimonadales bacterium]|nr:hypothetical protein [Gemmatimonadales bacterium]
MIPIRRLFPALLLIPAVALGCKKPQEEPAPPVGEAAVPAPVAVQVASFDLGKAVGPDFKVTAPRNAFGVRDTIYVSIATTGTSAGASLATRWTFEDGQVVHEDSRTIAPTGPAVTEFHIMSPQPWPAGAYKVEVMLNGASAGTKDFTIK